MKKTLFLLLLLVSSVAAQNTTISSSMVDTDGIAWANGTWRIDFRPNPAYPNESTYRLLNGQPLAASTTHQNGVLDASGHFSITIYDSTLIAPTGSGWTITLCSLTIAPCGTYQFSSAGSNMDISSNLTTAIAAPRFPPNNGAYGYADVEVQTSLNQGASYWNVTSGTQHIWNGQAWVVGGGAGLPPGVTGDGNNGLNVIGAVTASSLPGYRQNTIVARSRDRDEVLAITLTPQDMPGCQQSGQGNIDDAPCFAAAINYMASQDPRATKRLIVPYTYAGYTFRNPGFLQPLPHDFGDYHGFAGYAAAASVSLTIAAGAVQSCTTSGGSGYAPSATLPIAIFDPSLKGSGAYAQVQTGPSGTPVSASCTIVQGGMAYPSSGVLAQVVAIGGDGAQGYIPLFGTSFANTTTGSMSSTVAPTNVLTVASGTNFFNGMTVTVAGAAGTIPSPQNLVAIITAGGGTTSLTLSASATVTVSGATVTGGGVVTNGGLGYGTSGGLSVPVAISSGLAGYSCTTQPILTSITSASTAAVTGINITGAGNTCSYTGTNAPGCPASTTCVPVAFGASCNGAQCSNIAPEPVNNLACAVATANNLTIEGVGNPTINGSWNGSTANLSQLALFCDPSGQQSNHITIRGINFQNAFFGFYFPYNVSQFTMDNVTFGTNVAFPFYAYGINTIQTPAVFSGPASRFQNINDQGYSGIICGGAWIGRTNSSYQATSNYQITAGGYQGILWTFLNGGGTSPFSYGNGHTLEAAATSPCGGIKVDNFNFQGAGTRNDALDAFFEQYIWKTQNGPATPNTSQQPMSNGLPTCKFTQTVSTDRTVDYQFGFIGANTANPGFAFNYPYYQCFPGVIQSPFVFVPRYSGATVAQMPDISFSDVWAMLYSARPLFNGKADILRVDRIVGRARTNPWAPPVDPYTQTTPSTETRGGINISSRASVQTRIEDVTIVPGFGSPFNPGFQYISSGVVQILPQANLYTRNVSSVADQGSWKLAKPDIAGGTLATLGTGCGTISGAVGGAAAGKFTSTGVTACVILITPTTPALSGINGYRCSGSDVGPGSPGAALSQTASTTSSCTLSGTITSGDSITWQAIAF